MQVKYDSDTGCLLLFIIVVFACGFLYGIFAANPERQEMKFCGVEYVTGSHGESK